MHYGHANVIGFCDRPFADVREMNRALIKNWNLVVTSDDEAWVLGDCFLKIGWQEAYKIMKQLNGKKYLVMGNHDKFTRQKYLDIGFAEVYNKNTTFYYEGHHFLLSHYPYASSPEEVKHAEENGYRLRYQDRRYEDKGSWLLHGHVHEKFKKIRRMINVGVDVWDFTPVSIDELISLTKYQGDISFFKDQEH